MNKEFYTYAEILMVLRKHYQDAKSKLDEMREMILINSKQPCFAKLELQLPTEPLIVDKESIQGPYVKLHITRSYRGNIGTFSRYSLKKMGILNGAVAYFSDNVSYKLNEENGNYSFDIMAKYLPWAYRPFAVVYEDKKEEFRRVYHELQELPLYHLPQQSIDINAYQSLWIEGNGVRLSNGNDNHVSLDYQMDDDKMHVNVNKKQNFYFIQELLNTKIPRYMLSKELVELIDKTDINVENIFFDDDVNRRSRYDFASVEDKGLVFKKIK